jgi:RNA polymerase-binding protein DksA
VGDVADAARVTARLAEERETTLRQLEDLTTEVERIVDAARDVATDDEHDPEGATIAYERARTTALVDQARAHLAAVEEAFAQLEAGTYGRCVSCGDEIGAERLEALPVATTCFACASQR